MWDTYANRMLTSTGPFGVLNPLYSDSNRQCVLAFRQTNKIKMKNMQVGIYSPHWTTQKTKINHHILVYVLSTDYHHRLPIFKAGENSWSKFLSITPNSTEDCVECN